MTDDRQKNRQTDDNHANLTRPLLSPFMHTMPYMGHLI